MPARRCRRICCSPGTCSVSRPTDSIRSRTRRRNDCRRGIDVPLSDIVREGARTIKARSQRSDTVWSDVLLSSTLRTTTMQNSKIFGLIGNLRRPALFLFLFGLAISSGVAANAQTLVLTGGNVIKSPDAAPLADAVVVTPNGVLPAIGSRSDVQIPKDAHVIDCTGKTVVAGFWNSHVHFTQPVWRNAASAPVAPLEEHMREMLTKWGFTTVWDLGSDPNDTLALRRRIYANEVAGPNIFLAGSIFPKDGHPVYLPAEMKLPEAATPDEAAQMARGYLGMGLDGVKLFTGASMG